MSENRIILIVLCLVLSTYVSGFAQIIYSKKFTERLFDNELSFVEPVEGLYKPKMLFEDDYADYDLVIESTEEQTELRFMIEDELPELPLQMHCFLLSNQLAINDDTFSIRMQTLSESQLQACNAEWGVQIDFIPKESLSGHYYAKLNSLYRAGFPLIHTLILYDHMLSGPEKHMGRIYFNPLNDSLPSKIPK